MSKHKPPGSSCAMSERSPEYQEILTSGLFSRDWYLAQYRDVAAAGVDPLEHFLAYGVAEGRDPGPEFSTRGYLGLYGDVVKAGVNPLLHYVRYGKAEGRLPKPPVEPQVVERTYRNLAEYLKHSLLNPLMQGPFAEEDKRCFAVMENVARWLCRKLKECSRPPLVSIIMPMRDRASAVGDAIRSVLAQTYRNFELIVIDDGSQDEGVSVVRAFADPRIHLLESDQSTGVSAARNRGLSVAKGELIAYLDSDNTWLPDYLCSMAGAFQVLSDADAVYCGQYLYRNDEEHPFAVRFGCFNPTLLRNNNYIDLNCLVHRLDIIKDIGGGFCEEMKRWVDWELILRISDVGKIYSIPILQSNYFHDKADNTISATEEIGPARVSLKARSGYGYINIRGGGHPLTQRVAIIIPSYETLDHLRSCLESLADLAPSPLVQIIIVDNASGADVTSYLRQLESSGVKVIFNDYNYGFSYAVNQGAQLADPQSDILLLNNDAVLTPGALGALQGAAYACESIAIAAPQQVLSGGEPTITTHVPYADNSVPCDVTLSSHHRNIESLPLFHAGGTVELGFAPFFCVYIKRQVWELCGGLDAQHGRHYRSDRIMCEYVRHVLGMRIVYTPASVVFHHHQVATKVLKAKSENSLDYQTIFERNRWPDDIETRLNYQRPAWDFD